MLFSARSLFLAPATYPAVDFYPVPVFGLTFQATPATRGFDQNFSDDGFTWRAFARYVPERRHQPLCHLRARPPAEGAVGAAAGAARAHRRVPARLGRDRRQFRNRRQDRRARPPPLSRRRAFLLQIRQLPDDRAGRNDLHHQQCRQGRQLRLRRPVALPPEPRSALVRQLRLQPRPLQIGRVRRQPLPPFARPHLLGRRDARRRRRSAAGSISRPAVTYQSKVFFDNDNDRPGPADRRPRQDRRRHRPG